MTRRKRSKAKAATKSQDLKDNKVRLFIDPASISSGWALFKGKELVDHGTISVDRKFSVYIRLMHISSLYRTNFSSFNLDEVHIEQLPRRCHHFTHWSAGVIGCTLQAFASTVDADIPVRSWQKHANWDDIEDSWKKRGLKSEDELAAICMGEYWVNERI